MVIPVGTNSKIVFYTVLKKTKHLKFKYEGNIHMNYSSKYIRKRQRGTLDCAIYSLINALRNLEEAYQEALSEIETLKKQLDHKDGIIKY